VHPRSRARLQPYLRPITACDPRVQSEQDTPAETIAALLADEMASGAFVRFGGRIPAPIQSLGN